MQHSQVARALLEIDAVGFAPDAPITFKSGIISPVYVDNRRLPYHSAQWRLVIEAFKALIERESLACDVIAGVAVGGVPHSSALAYLMQRPSVFIRKEAKEHGKRKRVEGGEVAGRRVVLVEDVVTTGGSSLGAVSALREEDALAEDVLTIISYDFQEAKQAFDGAGVHLRTLTNFAAVMEEALGMGKLSQAQVEIVKDWFDDPHGWQSRHGIHHE